MLPSWTLWRSCSHWQTNMNYLVLRPVRSCTTLTVLFLCTLRFFTIFHSKTCSSKCIHSQHSTYEGKRRDQNERGSNLEIESTSSDIWLVLKGKVKKVTLKMLPKVDLKMGENRIAPKSCDPLSKICSDWLGCCISSCLAAIWQQGDLHNRYIKWRQRAQWKDELPLHVWSRMLLVFYQVELCQPKDDQKTGDKQVDHTAPTKQKTTSLTLVPLVFTVIFHLTSASVCVTSLEGVKHLISLLKLPVCAHWLIKTPDATETSTFKYKDCPGLQCSQLNCTLCFMKVLRIVTWP